MVDVLAAHSSWVVVKGGITSHDMAVRGLGIRGAEVLGQLLPGMVSVFRSVEAAPGAVSTPYVVFADTVGTNHPGQRDRPVQSEALMLAETTSLRTNARAARRALAGITTYTLESPA